MNLFGLSFLLFILKWSAGKGFWYQPWVTDKPTLKKIITVERKRKKIEKCKFDIYVSQSNIKELLFFFSLFKPNT